MLLQLSTVALFASILALLMIGTETAIYLMLVAVYLLVASH